MTFKETYKIYKKTKFNSKKFKKNFKTKFV